MGWISSSIYVYIKDKRTGVCSYYGNVCKLECNSGSSRFSCSTSSTNFMYIKLFIN